MTQSSKTKTGNDLAAASDNRYSFLGYGDWECSRSPDFAFKSGCLKHDVSYSSLRKFVPNRPADVDDEGDDYELDEAWNPRNKYLADVNLYHDLIETAETWDRLPAVCTSTFDTLARFDRRIAVIHYLSCNPAETIVDRTNLMWWTLRGPGQPDDWEQTTQIISDVALSPRYAEYPAN